MSNPGKAIAGIIITGAGVFISTIPGVGQLVGPMVMYYGANMLYAGVIGDPDAVGQGSKFTASSTQGTLPVVYGERKIAHYWADIRTHGTDNSWLDMMAGICIAGESGKDIEGVTGIWLYEDELTVDTPTMGNTNSDGQVTNVISKYYKDPQYHYIYNIGGGKDTQETDARMATLFPDEWGVSSTLTHQEGRGIVTCFHGFFWDKAEEDNVWARGQPDRDIKYTVRGALLYDPRYKTAGPDNDGWIWSYTDNPSLNQSGLDNHPGRNPALQVLDYLTSKRYGMGIPYAARGTRWGPDDQIDEQSFIDMANHCDEDVTTTGLDTNVTLPRYTSNIIISTGDTHKSNLERLLGTCNGMLAYEGGKFKILPRKVETPVSYEITESEIIGELTVTREGTTVPNIITVRYPNQDANYIYDTITWPYDAFNDSQNGYLEADNDIPVEKNVDLVGVTDSIHAQHLAMTLLKELREDTLVEVLCRESALQLSVNDVVRVTYDSAGWTQKLFRVTTMEILNDNTVRLNLREYDASVYSLDPNADIPTVPGTDLPNPFTVTPPTLVTANCAAGYYLNDATFIPRVELTWTHSADEFAHEEEVVYRRDADTEWTYTGIVKKISDTAAVAWEGDLDIGETYWFGVFARNRIGVISAIAETTASCTITGPGDTPSDVSITASDYTCLEGMTLSFDNPAVYTDPGLVGAREIGFFSVEIREQGAGATELDRWNAGTHLETVFGTEWNYPFDKVTKGTYDLTVRRFDKYGAPATTPTEITLTLSAYPCTGFGDSDPEELGSVVNNGDFEKGFAYWYSSATTRTSLETVSPIGGAISLKITADGAVDTDVSQTIDAANDESSGGSELKLVPTVPFESWWLGGSAYTSSTNTFEAVIEFFDEDKVSLSETTVITWDDNSAASKAKSFLAPDGAYYWNLILRAKAGTGDCYVDQLRCVSLVQFQPYAHYDIVHNGGTPGTADVTVRIFDLADRVYDFDMRIWDVANQTWGAWVDDSDPSITVTPFNSFTTDYTWTVTLDEKHDTYTEYSAPFLVQHVGPFDTPGVYVDVGYLREVITLDVDTVPFVTNLQLSVRDDGSVDLDWGCDDDGNSIKYTKSTTSYTAAGDPTGGTTLNGTSGNEVGIHTLAYGETLYVRTIAYTGATGTGDPGTKETEAQVTHLGGATYPVVQEQLSYSGSNGVLDLDITDPDSRVTQVQFTTKSGLAAWSGWAVDTAPYQATVALTEKHDSHIAWRVSFTKIGGATGVIEGNVTFDVDTNPEIMSLDLNIEDNGAARLSYAGDDDVASIKWATSTSEYPLGATVDAVTPPTNTNDGRTDSDVDLNAGTIASGDTLYVSFYAYNGTQASGTKSSQLYQIKRTRLSGTDTILPTVQAQITGTGNNEITLVLNDPQDLVTGVGFRKYERNVTTNVMEWGSWVDDTVAPYNLTTTITRDEKHNTIIAWRVRYNPGTGNEYIENVIVYDPDLTPQINSVDVDVDDDGNVYLSYSGDDDTLSIKYETDLTDFPTYAETTTGGTVVNATASDNINIGTLAEGATMFVSVAAYPEASGGGTANTKMGWGRVTRPTDTTSGQGSVEILNGNFENFFAFWVAKRTSNNGATLSSISSGVTQNNTGAFSPLEGNYDCRIEARTDTNEVRLYVCASGYKSAYKLDDPRDFAAVEGDVIKMRGWMYNSSLSGPDGGFGVQWYNSSGTILQTDERNYGGVADESFSLTTAPAPANTAYCRLYLYTNANAAASGYYTYFDSMTATLSQVADSDINELNDVDTTGVGDDYVLTYNSGSQTWEAQPASGGASTLAELTNVTDASSAAGWFLRSTGAATWAAQLGIDVSDTNAEPALGNPASDGYHLSSTAAGVRSWVAEVSAEPPLGNPASDGYHLSSTAAGVRSWVAPPTAATTLDALTDTSIAGPTPLDVLQWNGADWVDRSLSEAGIASATHNHDLDYADISHNHSGTYEVYLGVPAQNGYILSSNTGGFRSWIAPPTATTSLAAMTDTIITGPVADGEILVWDTNDWINQTLVEAGIAILGHNHDGTYSPVGHDHNTMYATIGHTHTGVYAPFSHNHSGTYEVYLGVPGVNGYVLSSTTAGVRTWVAQTGGSSTLYGLTDTNISGTPANNEVLAWDTTSGDWTNQTAAEAGLATQSHTHTSNEIAVRVERAGTLIGSRGTINFLNTGDDINVTVTDDGNEIDIDIDYTGTASATQLSDLTDVVFTTRVEDDVMSYNNATGKWNNRNFTEANIAHINHNHSGTYEPVITTLPVSKGGTGNTSYTGTRLLQYDGTDFNTVAQSCYVDSTKLYVANEIWFEGSTSVTKLYADTNDTFIDHTGNDLVLKSSGAAVNQPKINNGSYEERIACVHWATVGPTTSNYAPQGTIWIQY